MKKSIIITLTIIGVVSLLGLGITSYLLKNWLVLIIPLILELLATAIIIGIDFYNKKRETNEFYGNDEKESDKKKIVNPKEAEEIARELIKEKQDDYLDTDVSYGVFHEGTEKDRIFWIQGKGYNKTTFYFSAVNMDNTDYNTVIPIQKILEIKEIKELIKNLVENPIRTEEEIETRTEPDPFTGEQKQVTTRKRMTPTERKKAEEEKKAIATEGSLE